MRSFIFYITILLFFGLTNNVYASSITEELTQLNNLFKEGAITKEEFSKAKSILLNQSGEKIIIDEDSIKALIDKSLEQTEENLASDNDSSKNDKNLNNSVLSLSEEDAIKAQIFRCWSIPLGLPYNENLLVRIKLKLEPDGTISEIKILDHDKMNQPGQGFYKVLVESVLRAIKLCEPLKVPTDGYERWKELHLNFDAREMLSG